MTADNEKNDGPEDEFDPGKLVLPDDQPNSEPTKLKAVKPSRNRGKILKKSSLGFLIFGGYSDQSIKDNPGSNSLSADQYDKTSQYLTAVEIIKSLKLR